jgi:hypothetical protein
VHHFGRKTNWSKQKKEVKGEFMAWRTKVQAKVQGCSFLHFFSFFLYFKKNLCCSNFMRMEEMLWIENINESTQAPPFLTNFRVDMASFVHPHKVLARRNAFSAFQVHEMEVN